MSQTAASASPEHGPNPERNQDLAAALEAALSPPLGAPVAVGPARAELSAFLATRRSTPAAKLSEPGPDATTLGVLLGIAARVPDHGKLSPWRFVVFEGPARAAAGAVLARTFAAQEPDAPQERLTMEEERFLRAPCVVMVVSTAREDHKKIPEWEQILSAGAVCQNLLLAAGALGFGAQWLTEWYAYDRDVRAAFGLKPGERVAGYIYLGTQSEPIPERARPDVEDLTTHWNAP